MADTDLAAEVLQLFRTRGLRLALAESCTGGLCSHMLTSVPGASDVLHSCVVAYCDDAKTRILGVSPAIIREYGAISPEAASAMALGALSLTGADAALAVTGNLGPQAAEGKPVGLVHIAAAMDQSRISQRTLTLSGDREEIKLTAARMALQLLCAEVPQWTA